MADVALIHKNKQELQKMLDITDEVSKKYHIQFDKEKSQIITIGKNQEPKFKLGNMIMDNTETYKYLGITINNKCTMEDHIKKLKGKTEAALQTIFNLAGNKNFSQIEMKTIWKLIETCIIPIVLYAAETWIPTKAEVEHIQKILNNTLKRILQTPPSTPSEIIQIETGIWDIETMMEEKQIMYYHRIHNNPTGITKTTATETKYPWNTTIKTHSENTIWNMTQ